MYNGRFGLTAETFSKNNNRLASQLAAKAYVNR